MNKKSAKEKKRQHRYKTAGPQRTDAGRIRRLRQLRAKSPLAIR